MLLIKGRRESSLTTLLTPPPYQRKAALLMRRTIVLLATMALTVLVVSGVAWAVNKVGTNGPDTLRGTNGDDNLIGKGGNDVLYALRRPRQPAGRSRARILVIGGTEMRAPQEATRTWLGGPGNDIVRRCPKAPTRCWVMQVTTT